MDKQERQKRFLSFQREVFESSNLVYWRYCTVVYKNASISTSWSARQAKMKTEERRHQQKQKYVRNINASTF